MSDLLFFYGVTAPVSAQQETLPVVIGQVSAVAVFEHPAKISVIQRTKTITTIFFIIIRTIYKTNKDIIRKIQKMER